MASFSKLLNANKSISVRRLYYRYNLMVFRKQRSYLGKTKIAEALSKNASKGSTKDDIKKKLGII